jgi:RNA-directed DNA polymerase
MSELSIIQKTYDLIKWYIPILNRLPRQHKFHLGSRTIDTLYSILEGLITAKYSQNKQTQLENLNISLDILRYQTRLLFDFIETSFIPDSYSNRIGYGTHKAIRRFTHFVQSSEYVLQCDIQKYFPSIDRQILKNILRQKIKCPQTLWLIDLIIDLIIDNSNDQIPVHDYFDGDDLFTSLRRRGLPIGNLTSQFFANVYLNDFDHFVKEKLKIKKYIRYVDDFAFFSNHSTELTQVRQSIETYLATLRLKIHPIKSQIFTTKQGANFLGFRIFPTHIRVRSNNLRIGKKRICLLNQAVNLGKISVSTANLSILSWFAHLAHGDTWQLRSHICFSVKHCKAVK